MGSDDQDTQRLPPHLVSGAMPQQAQSSIAASTTSSITAPDLTTVGGQVAPPKPSWLALGGLVLVGTIVAFMALLVMLLVSITVAVGAVLWDLLQVIPSGNDAAAGERWLSAVGDALLGHLGAIIASAVVPVLVTWVIVASIYAIVIRAIWKWRVGWIWAMVSTAIGGFVGMLGYSIDTLLFGATLGMVGTLSTTLVTTALLRLRLKPPPGTHVGGAPLPSPLS